MDPEIDEGPDLRETITAAIDAGETEEPAQEGGAQAPGAPVEPSEPPAEGVEGAGRVRDSLGRFVPKAGGPEAQSAVAPGAPSVPAGSPAVPGALSAPGAAPTAVPAPQSWSASAREHWARLPPAAQQEVHRREQEMQRFVYETSAARQLGERFFQAVQPHMATIQAEGVDPLTAVTNLMQFGTRMRLGTPNEKASTVAEIVKAYGVDIQALDNALVGALPQQSNGADPQYIQQAVQQALAPIYNAAQQRQQQIYAQAQQGAATELQAFAQDGRHEFYGDLRGMMADLIEVAERNGRDLPLEEAYQRAAMLHPEVSKVIIARQQGVNARQLTAAAQRAKSAAVSVRGTAPVGNPNGVEPSSVRESIEAAIEAHSRY